MGIKKYLIAIILSVISIVIITGFTLQPALATQFGISYILLGDTASAQYFFIFTMAWVGPIIGFLFGYLLSPLFLVVHKITIGRKMSYGVEEIQDPNPDKFKGLLKGFFPALMSLNFAIIVAGTSWGVNILTTPTYTIDDTVLIIMIMLAITPGIAIAVFSPVWFLQDSGIVYSNQRKVKSRRIALEVRSVGGWYLYILKGYAGLSVIFSFYTIISDFIIAGTEFGSFIVQLLLPVLISLFIIPTLIILDITWEQRRKYVLKWARNYKRG